MPKVIVAHAKLDDQVERYLAVPITRLDIRNYTITRRGGDICMLTVEIYLDMERFEREPDTEITGINAPERTFMRPDGTTYTKEQ